MCQALFNVLVLPKVSNVQLAAIEYLVCVLATLWWYTWLGNTIVVPGVWHVSVCVRLVYLLLWLSSGCIIPQALSGRQNSVPSVLCRYVMVLTVELLWRCLCVTVPGSIRLTQQSLTVSVGHPTLTAYWSTKRCVLLMVRCSRARGICSRLVSVHARLSSSSSVGTSTSSTQKGKGNKLIVLNIIVLIHPYKRDQKLRFFTYISRCMLCCCKYLCSTEM